MVEFYNGANLVGSLGAAAVLTSIGSNPAYFGNPSGSFAGQDSAQPYAFVNFYDTTGTFDRIVFARRRRSAATSPTTTRSARTATSPARR